MKSQRESDAPQSSTRGSLADMRLVDATTALAVERLGSMTKAARELGVTPSQVSKTIARLQSWMRGPLFARSDADLVPTPRGRRFLDRMRPLVEALRELEGEVDAHDATRVVTSELAFSLVASALTEMTGGRFVVDVSGVCTVDSTGAEHDLVLSLAGDAPLAVRNSTTVTTVEWAVYAAPRLARRIERAGDDEARIDLVPLADPELDSTYGDVLRSLLHRRFRFGSRVPLHAALEVAASSEQLVIYPVALAAPFVRTERLVELDRAGEVSRARTALVAGASTELVTELSAALARRFERLG